MKRREILIVGSGFIGTALAKHLNSMYKVRTLSRKQQPFSLKKYKIPHNKCDITNYKKLEQVFGNPFLVIHTAAVTIPEFNNNEKKGFDIATQGTTNICKIVAKNLGISGLLILSTMRVFGEYDFSNAINEDSGIRINYTRKSSQKYVLSQINREFIVRSFGEMNPNKFFGILRVSTVLDSSRKNNFFINAFIEKAIKEQRIIVHKNSIDRPIFFVALTDISKTIEKLILKILSNKKFLYEKNNHVLNLSYPQPLTILESANFVRDMKKKYFKNTISPKVKIMETKSPKEFVRGDKKRARYDISRVKSTLGLKKLVEPRTVIKDIIKNLSSNKGYID